jgi:hypothetical protein
MKGGLVDGGDSKEGRETVELSWVDMDDDEIRTRL